MDFRLEGKKVSLRPVNPSDIADYQRWNVPGMKAWDYDGPWYNDYDLTALIERRKKSLAEGCPPPYSSLEIDDRDGKHLGWVVVYYRKNDPHKTESGIDIVEDSRWGGGLGTEAFFLWTEYLFKELALTRIGFSTWEGNKGMLKIGEKLGFKEEARIRKACFVRGAFYDRISMGILREEWEAWKKVK